MVSHICFRYPKFLGNFSLIYQTKKHIDNMIVVNKVFTPQPLKAVRVLFFIRGVRMGGPVGLRAGGRKKFVWAVSQKP